LSDTIRIRLAPTNYEHDINPMPTATRTNPLSFLTDQLNELKQKGTYFHLRVLEDEQAPICTFDGKRVINLASNNYLGLTTHPKLRESVPSPAP
jgi:glycine C-acetyltransferase